MKKINTDEEKEKLNILKELEKEQNLIISLYEILNELNQKKINCKLRNSDLPNNNNINNNIKNKELNDKGEEIWWWRFGNC